MVGQCIFKSVVGKGAPVSSHYTYAERERFLMSRFILFFSVLFLSVLMTIAIPSAYAESGRLREWLQSRKEDPKNNAGHEEVYAEEDIDGTRTTKFYNALTCEKLSHLAASAQEVARNRKEPGVIHAQYGDGYSRSLNVYTPSKDASFPAPYPLIVMVHGGAWCVGDMAMLKVTKNKVAHWLPKGFVFVSVNYRMIPDGADPLVQTGDVADALAYIQKHAGEWNADPDKIILMGHSAGAHLVSLLGADAGLAQKHGVRPWLGTVSLDSAGMDIPQVMKEPHPKFYDDAFGSDQSFWKAASPSHHLSAASRSWLGVCSTQRKDACAQAHAFSSNVAMQNVKAGVLEENLKHGEINEKLGLPGAYTEAVEAFMASLDPDIAQRLKKAALRQ
jgi:acetyl esterase/lipase